MWLPRPPLSRFAELPEAMEALAAAPPFGNRFLHELAEMDAAHLAPELKRTSFTPGASLFGVNAALDWLYFPERAIVSIHQTCGDGNDLEVGLVGSEGIIGWPLLLGCQSSAHGATVHTRGGTMLSISAEAAAALARTSPALHAKLLKFVHVLTMQISSALVSHAVGSVERRVCRWLLMRHDRLLGDEIRVIHSDIAEHLGVRRAGVTDSLHVLEGNGALRCSRGRIIIRNRAALERAAGHAYGAAEAQYCRLIGPFGKTNGDGISRVRQPTWTSWDHPPPPMASALQRVQQQVRT